MWLFLGNNSSVVLIQRKFRRMFKDFFLGVHLKASVYVNNPQTLQKLRKNIQQEIENLMENAIKRAQIRTAVIC